MAILLSTDEGKIYFSENRAVTNQEKKKADMLDAELDSGIKEISKEFLQEKLVLPNGRKKDALKVWFCLGKFLLNLAKKYNIFETKEEIYYWRAVYDHLPVELQKNPRPKDYHRLKSNQYRKAALMAQYQWGIVKEVGSWSVWNDILDNPKILDDKRLLDWVIKEIIKQQEVKSTGHKEIRKFLYSISDRLDKFDTHILTNDELVKKLNEIDKNKYF